MAKRTINAGIDEEFIRSLGVVPWDERKVPRQPDYVRGAYDDDPLGTLLWRDLRAGYRRNGIDCQHATMFELILAGQSYRQVAATFHLGSQRSVQYWVEHVKAALLADSRLGLITSIYEECGGWQAVAEFLFS